MKNSKPTDHPFSDISLSLWLTNHRRPKFPSTTKRNPTGTPVRGADTKYCSPTLQTPYMVLKLLLLEINEGGARRPRLVWIQWKENKRAGPNMTIDLGPFFVGKLEHLHWIVPRGGRARPGAFVQKKRNNLFLQSN